ncbi:MAG: calcium-binding EGF-like domain-containing protein [Chitinophagaceae bacterium]
MKTIVLTALSTFILFFSIAYTGCKPDKCKNVTCAYSGTCKDGSCICQTGYEGTHCETIMREKFKGIWNVNEDGSLTGAAQYTMSIEEGDVINEVKIRNFQNHFQEPVIGVVHNDSIVIPIQSFSNGYTVDGVGYIVGTNPLNQHYYQHAVVYVYYKVVNNIGVVNEYGTGGSNGPSLWSK